MIQPSSFSTPSSKMWNLDGPTPDLFCPGLLSCPDLYIEALYAFGKVTFVHTKVFISCCRHIGTSGASIVSKTRERTTDDCIIKIFRKLDRSEAHVDIAIKLFRDMGMYKVAEWVSRCLKRHTQLGEILRRDTNGTDAVLSLLRQLGHDEVLTAFLPLYFGAPALREQFL